MKQIIIFQVLFHFLLIQWKNIINAQNIVIGMTENNMRTNQTAMKQSDGTVSTMIKNQDNIASTTVNQQSLSRLFCEKRDKPYFIPYKIDVNKFYVCVKGQLFLLNCPSDYWFDSKIDQCRRKTVDNRKESKLKEPISIPHETNCGWFYVVRIEATGERVLNSCPMPQLFDIMTLKCKNYTEVNCQDRFEPKDACDYQIRSSAHAYPCSYLPSCKNRPDGLYPDHLRDCRMYFRCTSERSSESYSCAQHILPLGERFSFERQRCLPAQYVKCIDDSYKSFF